MKAWMQPEELSLLLHFLRNVKLIASIFSIVFPSSPFLLPLFLLPLPAFFSHKQQVLLVFTDGLDDDLERMKETSELLRKKGKCLELPFAGLAPPIGAETVFQIPNGTGTVSS